LALDGSERSASRTDRFSPGGKSPGTHWIGGWVGTRARLDAVVKKKIPCPCREPNPRTPKVQPVAQSLYRVSYHGYYYHHHHYHHFIIISASIAYYQRLTSKNKKIKDIFILSFG
jgi:hypothetical protein